jgi:hypothetical protein
MRKVTVFRDTEVERLACCGILEITGLQDDSLHTILSFKENDEANDSRYAFAIFSDVMGREGNKGKNLARYIRKHKLGKVRSSSPKRNFNTSSIIKMWIWEVNHEALQRFFDKFDIDWDGNGRDSEDNVWD